MRKRYTPPTSIFQNTDNTPKCYISGKDSTNTLCNISTHNTLNDYQICKFEFCSFISVSSDNTNGGAIFFHRTESTSLETSLTVNNCFFLSCKANNGNPNLSSGGVSARYVSDVTITSCFFKQCESSGTGGLFLQHLSHQPSISECTFYTCRCPKTGAGAYVGYCALEVSPVFCYDCRFLKGEPIINEEYSLAGGGLSLSSDTSNRANTIVNVIFAYNRAINGGGLSIYQRSGLTPSVKFCFFSENTVTNKGHDINLSEVNENPLFRCFTYTTQTTTLFVNPPYQSTPESPGTSTPNWLPHACN